MSTLRWSISCWGLFPLRIAYPKMLKDSGLTEKNLRAAIEELRKGKKVTTSSAEGSYNALNKYAVHLNERARNRQA